MMTKRILFLSGYREDRHISMLVYAEGLIEALHKYSTSDFIANEFIPKMLLPPWLLGKWGMRFARYILYPFQAPQPKGAITHILDHGYSQILYTRNPDKTIVTVTDLMPVLWWKGLLPVQVKKGIPFTVLYSLYALKRATHIITISSNTKNDLVKLIGCEPSKISVVYLGVDPIFKPYKRELKNIIRNGIFGPEPRKLLMISGSQFYKNHETALKTITYLLANGLNSYCLVKTGNPNQDWLNLVKKHGMEKNVINLGFIPREQMPDIYNAVDVLLFPSLYEGFGWPPLEAMACGTPAVTSNVASLPEVMGDIDTTCAPLDYIGFAQKIESLLNTEEYRQGVIRQGILQSAKFTWEDTAKQVIDIYKMVDG